MYIYISIYKCANVGKSSMGLVFFSTSDTSTCDKHCENVLGFSLLSSACAAFEYTRVGVCQFRLFFGRMFD